MTFAVHVQDGTRAGRKRPLRDTPKPWLCRCAQDPRDTLPGYLVRCPNCGTRRPD